MRSTSKPCYVVSVTTPLLEADPDAQLARKGAAAPRIQLDAESRLRLESLGYVN